MTEELTTIERINRRKGRNYSIAIHVILLLLLLIFWRFPANPPDNIDTQYAVAVDFTMEKSSNSTKGQEAAGESAPPADKDEQAQSEQQQEEVPDVPEEVEEQEEEVVEDEPIIDEPVEEMPEVEEVIEEDSPIEAVEDIPIDKPIKVTKPDVPKKASKPTAKPTKPTSKPAETKGKGTGKKNSTSKPTGGSGSGKSTSGSGSGKDKSGNDGSSGIGTGGNGAGKYDDSGRGIFGRRVTYIPQKELNSIMKKSGRIEVKVCVDPYGDATYTEINYKNTTLKDRALLKKTLKVAEKYRFEKDLRAPDEQCGKLIFILKIPE